MIYKELLFKISQQYSSFYIYEEESINYYANILTSSFGDVKFLYSLKTNPYPSVRQTVFNNGFGADAASYNEVLYAFNAGLSKKMIQYSAPGKTYDQIRKSLDKATIIADSLNEIELINAAAKEANTIVDIGIRINPNFTIESNVGSASKFGIDEDIFIANKTHILGLSNINIVGFHVHSKSQILDKDLIKNYHLNVFDLVLRLSAATDDLPPMNLKFINLGSGLGLPYGRYDTAIDVNDIGAYTSTLVHNFKEIFPDADVYIETGRYVVGKCGTYVTRVLDKKTSHGKTFIILSNTLNGFIRPSMNQLISNYIPPTIIKSSSKIKNDTTSTIPASEPLFTSFDSFPPVPLQDIFNEDTETITIVGNLCTAIDVVSKDITLPVLEIGDLITFEIAGAYSAVITPTDFSSQDKPLQLFLTENGNLIEQKIEL